MKKPRKLAEVSDPTGRLDVAAYRAAERMLERLERERGIAGLREHILPLIESALLENVPARNIWNEIPEELKAIFHVCMQNSGRLL